MDWNDKYQTVSPKITIFWEIWKKKLLLQKIKNLSEKQKYQEALIDKIYGIGSYFEKSEFRDYVFANQSLCFLLDFIYKHNPSLVKDIDYPIFENHSNKLVLANHSLKQLNIISKILIDKHIHKEKNETQTDQLLWVI